RLLVQRGHQVGPHGHTADTAVHLLVVRAQASQALDVGGIDLATSLVADDFFLGRVLPLPDRPDRLHVDRRGSVSLAVLVSPRCTSRVPPAPRPTSVTPCRRRPPWRSLVPGATPAVSRA